MSWRNAVLITMALGLLAAACAPAATPEPTAVPAPADPTWERIQANGKMNVGTSGDYRPFEYYNEQFLLDGFDVALIEAIGQKIGVPAEVTDFAFDGLAPALQIGQIDAAIAAISVTDERQTAVDFSNIYFVGAGVALAKQGAGIGPLTSADQLAQYRVGVQDASVYQTELLDLVEFGRMAPTNVFTYVKADEGITAVKDGAIDLFVMDDAPAKEAVALGGVEIAGTGLTQQRYAIALPKGSPTLLAAVNQALIDLTNDGTIARLTEQYMQFTPAEVAPPQAVPTATPVPGPTATAAPTGCVDAMAYVADLNYDDENMKDPVEMDPNEDFEKGWRLKNVGTCEWTSKYSIRYVYGNESESDMDGETTYVSGTVKPGQTYDMYVELEAPSKPDTYQGFWQMFNAKGQAFGQTVWVGIVVPGEEPEPTAAPEQPTAVPAQPPAIQYFQADPTQIDVGVCTTLSWSFSGESLADAWITRNTERVFNDLPTQGSVDDCGLAVGQYTYVLQVSSEFAGTAQKQALVEVVELQVNPQ